MKINLPEYLDCVIMELRTQLQEKNKLVINLRCNNWVLIMKKTKSKKNTFSYKLGKAIGKELYKIGKAILKKPRGMVGRR